MNAYFHCSNRARKSIKSAKHRIEECCDTLKTVLNVNPNYGVLVKGTKLRKMRLNVPSLNVGKRGGYRLIYKAEIIDECWRIVFLTSYFKGDKSDLTVSEYATITDEVLKIYSDIDELVWDS